MKIKLLIVLMYAATVTVAYADAALDAELLQDEEAAYTAMPKITIKAGSHTLAENAAHQKYCAAKGEVDVTDKNDVIVGVGNVDPMNSTIICMGTLTKEAYEEELKSKEKFVGVHAISTDDNSDNIKK